MEHLRRLASWLVALFIALILVAWLSMPGMLRQVWGTFTGTAHHVGRDIGHSIQSNTGRGR